MELQAALTTVLVHDAPVGGVALQPPAVRAACGEGSAARALLLDFLPLRFGLLRLRQASRSCRLLVSECKLSTQIAAGQVRVLNKPKSALAMVEAFPLAISVKVCIDSSWTLESFGACAHCPTLEVSLHDNWVSDPTFSGLSILQRLRNLKAVHLPAAGLSDASFRQLAGTTSLALTSPRHRNALAFSPASISLARSLRELSLNNFGDRVTHADLAPVAGQLTKLTLHDCWGVTDFTSFAALLELRIVVSDDSDDDIGFECSSLPLQLQSLWVSAPPADIRGDGPDRLTFPPAIALRSFELVCEFVAPEVLERLPSALESFSLCTDMFYSSDLEALCRLRQLRSLTCRGDYVGGPLEAQHVAVFAQLESLTIDGAGWELGPHSTGRLSRLRHLQCSEKLFRFADILLDMPVLETLSLFRYSEDYITSPVQLLVCILRKPTLREISFASNEAEARTVYLGVVTAITCTPGARMWWKLDLSALAQGVSAPASLNEDDGIHDGWLLLGCGPTSQGRESRFAPIQGHPSCTRPWGSWGGRWPKMIKLARSVGE